MTVFQGQSARRQSNKKIWKYDKNQRNATFIFITFRNHRPIIFVSFHICKCRRIRKSHQKRAPELGMPTGWKKSEVRLRNICQFIKIEWNRKRNEIETYFWWVSGIVDETFWVFFFQMFMYGKFLKSRKKWKRVFLKWEPVVSESRASRWTFVLILEVDEFSITVSDVPSKCSFECVLISFLLSEMRVCFSLSDVWTC